MKFQEAKNLRVNDDIFIIDNNNKVCPKKVTGIQLRTGERVDVTFISNTEKTIGNGYILEHGRIFLKEEHALEIVLDKCVFQRNEMEKKVIDVRAKITKLTQGGGK